MSLNQPPQLVGWNLRGGDPCEEAWKGISCSGSSVIIIKLNGLELSGRLGGNLSDLLHLKQLDFSHNYIEGEVPIDLSCNNFKNTNLSLDSMKYLEHLNLSHNSLSGPLGNAFTGFPNLKQMDLSHNKFTGNLPSTFENLTNLKSLFLRNNEFNGSVSVLVPLGLQDLDIRMNRFNAHYHSHGKILNFRLFFRLFRFTNSDIAMIIRTSALKERESRFNGKHNIYPVLPIVRTEGEGIPIDRTEGNGIWHGIWPAATKFANAQEVSPPFEQLDP
ncbi:hypothetical protein MKW92_019011 [Papaver armeniacum]|nr:hypothetical protein MKW92_019011 [Papaver armeniacum]